ncbi:nucleotidyltransferase family protein [soil metagenome]
MGIEVDRERIAGFCRRWRITELSLFGSVLRDDFRPESDVDVLVVFAPEAEWGFGDLLQMEEELTEIFGHRADLVEKRFVEQNRNYIIRKHILRSAEPAYVV